jgi:hypothetical protein
MTDFKTSAISIPFPRTRVSQRDYLLLYIIYVGVLSMLWLQSDFSPFNNKNNNNIKLSEGLVCSSAVAVTGSIQSAAHTGAAITLPVGSNIAGLKKWSVASSWIGATKPVAGDDVIIPANSILVLDENTSVKSITVLGKLIIDLSKNVSINTEYIVVSGTGAYFEIGTPSQPFPNKVIITFTGNDPTKKIPGTVIESKGLLVEKSAVIEFHGKIKTSWTNLAANAAVGSNTITIATATNNWEIGDEIIIAPSRLNENEGEKRTITAISADKKTFTLNASLGFPHIGQSKQYTRPSDGKTWTGDMRAEVGLLTKSITLQGDASSETNQFGAHVMIHMSGVAHVEGIELYRVGQKSILGRYPFHWHLIQELGAGQYFKNSSVHRSYNRAITIHGTESTLVENNFCYDHIGHGVFLEDGSERYNIIRGNVVLLTKRPVAGEELVPSDNEANEVQNRTPASFWITNPNNTFENNVAAGTQGTGFWFAMPRQPMANSASIPRFVGMQPYKEPLGKFAGNKAHSCASGFDIFDQLTASHALIRNGAWERTDTRVMDNCTWYACDLAVYGGIGGGRRYTEGVVFRNNVFLDNVTSVMHANYSMIEQSVFVANSGENVFVGDRMLNRGYDGACTIKDCHMVGWQAANANYVQNTGGALKHVNYRVSGMTMDHSGPPRMSFPDYSKTPVGDVGANDAEHPRFWSYIHWDKDGSLGGKANTSIVTNHPLCRDATEVRFANWTNLYRTDRRFAFLVITAPGDPNMTIVRTKAGTPKAGQYYVNGFYGGSIQFPVMVNDGFLYTLQFESLGTGKTMTIRMQDDYVPGDKVVYRIKSFGNLPGVQVGGITRHTNLANFNASNQSGYVLDNGDLYLKMVSISSTPDIGFTITWTSNITLPLLDTDGDGISDKQESIDGTDPIPNDAIALNPVITPTGCTALITSPTTSFCTGGSVILTASAGSSYKWFNGTTQVGTAATYTATTAGSYTVEVTNASGCKATSAAKVITVNTLPTATITSPTNSFCTGGSVVLTASTGTSYKWMNGTTQVGTAATYTATTAGSYTVEVTNASGCKATSAVTTITVNALPTATITSPANSFCTGGSVILTASAGSSYKWFNGTTQVGTASTYTATAAGSYTVEVTNANGCKATSVAKVITVNALPTATITSPANAFCTGGSVILTSSTGTSYKWFNGTTQVGTAATYTATTAGSYTVEVTNASGCKATSAAKAITATAASTWYADADNDGKGDPTATITACTQPVGYVSIAGDGCPTDANKIAPGICGCGVTESSCTNQPQTISFTPFNGNKIIGDPDFNLTASSTSGLTITYTSSNPAVATVVGNTVKIVGTGTTVITASQSGNAMYAPTSITQTLTVTNPVQQNTLQVLDGTTLLPNNGTAVSIGSSPLNSMTSNKTITLKNTGTSNLTITGIAASPGFSATQIFPSGAIAPNQTATIFISGTPTSSTGSTMGVITILSSGTPQTFTLHVSVEMSTTTATTSLLSSSQIELYPNPTTDQLYIGFNGSFDDIEVTIFSIEGKLMQKNELQSAVNSEKNISTAELPAGVYFLEIKTKQGKIVKRVVKQ